MLIRPGRESAEIKALAATARREAQRAEIPLLKTFRSRRGTVAGEWFQGPIEFLEPQDAYDLYQRTHRWRVLVVSFTRVYVRRDPSRDPVVRRAALELGSFVEHKAVNSLARSEAGLIETLQRFMAPTAPTCAGEDDPRCLPLHVFAVDRVWSALSEQGGRDVFSKLHGGPRSRVDSESKRWARATRAAYHGTERLTIAGHDLAPGMHWDVTSERRPARLTTSKEVWEVPSASHGHINVYPDAYVRPGSGARLLWPKRQRPKPS